MKTSIWATIPSLDETRSWCDYVTSLSYQHHNAKTRFAVLILQLLNLLLSSLYTCHINEKTNKQTTVYVIRIINCFSRAKTAQRRWQAAQGQGNAEDQCSWAAQATAQLLSPWAAAQGGAFLHPAHLICNTDNLPWIIESWLQTAELH